MSKRKYSRGRQIKSLDVMMRQTMIIQRVGPHEVTVPFGWYQCWQMVYAKRQIDCGNVYVAKEAAV